MESDNIVIGKINKKKCYLNNGKYGHYLNHYGKNYKVPEWFPVDKFDIDVAERLLNIRKRCLKCIVMNQQRKPNQQNKMNQKVRKKHLNKPKQKNK